MREFRFAVPEADLDDLRARLRGTRWPEQATEAGWAQGVPLDYARELCAYWAEGYDWRRCEAALGAWPQYLTGLDGGGADTLDVQFLHARSPHPGALPLLLTHGWPGSVIEFLPILDALVDPPDPADAFSVVAPTLPGYGWSGKPASPGWGVERIAAAWAQLMDRLGYDRYGAAGGDWGAFVTAALGSGATGHSAGHVAGVHVTMPIVRRPAEPGPLTECEQAGLAAVREFEKLRSGYSAIQATRPQTMGYGLVDSPAALATWIVEKFWDWTDCAGHPENVISRDTMLDDVMCYWLPAAGASAARLYRESYGSRRLDPVTVPSGVTLFPKELWRLPRSWVETRFTDLRHWSEPDVGGHFASLEQPEVYVRELRTFFRPLR